MSKHQVIYTSCRKGIKGSGSGFQIYSYDKDFGKITHFGVDRMFGYNHPELPAGQVMTDELAPTMPKSFSFFSLNDNFSMLASRNYLGRDYMGKTGRFGNFLNHFIFFCDEEIVGYPVEYYCTASLKTELPSEWVNSEEIPPYLPAPQLEKGSVVNFESIANFLSPKGRAEIFSKMLTAFLLATDNERKILIADSEENIIFWIAAITYALPKNLAKKISFDTYAFNPAMSSAQICGVVKEGTYYNDSLKERHFVFDLLNNSFPDIAVCDYAENLSKNFSNREETEKFFLFLADTVSANALTTPNKNIIDGYTMYLLLNGKIPLPFSILEFCSVKCNETVQHKLANEILQQEEVIVSKCSEKDFSPIADFFNAINLTAEEKSAFTSLCAKRFLMALDKNEKPESMNYNFAEMFNALLQTKSYNSATKLFRYQMEVSAKQDVASAEKIFKLYWQAVEKGHPLNQNIAVEEHFKILTLNDDFSSCDSKLTFFIFLHEKNLSADYQKILAEKIFDSFSLKRPDNKTKEIIDKIMSCADIFSIKSEVKDFLLLGRVLEEQVKNFKPSAGKTTEKNNRSLIAQYDFSDYKSSELKEYFQWIIPSVCKLCETGEDMKKFYDCFTMSDSVSNLYLTMSFDNYLRTKSFSKFSEFFIFLSQVKGALFFKTLGQNATDFLSKKELQNLGKELETRLKKVEETEKVDKIKKHWEIFSHAANPGLLGRIGNIFRGIMK